MKTFTVLVDVEPKEDVTSEGIRPSMPSAGELSSRLNDVLADQTKHDEQTGWRVLRVRLGAVDS